VLEETLVDGGVDGERRELYLDGSPRQVSWYREGSLDGLRVAWYPNGQERWRALYEKGWLVSVEGDTAVAGEPCPENTLPVASADGLEAWCERRTGGWSGTRHGAYVVWGDDGSVVERGLYRHGDKQQVWEAAPGAAVPVAVPAGELVAEASLYAGEMPLETRTSVAPSFWFRNLDSGEHVNTDVEVEGSLARIFGLEPGRYHLGGARRRRPRQSEAISRRSDRQPKVRGGGGGGRGPRGAFRRGPTPLTEPFDNGAPVPGWDQPCERKPFLPGPEVRFAWAGPGSGAEYHYEVIRLSCDPFHQIDTLAEGSTQSLAVTVSLPPTPRGQIYAFKLHATRGDRTVGTPLSHGAGGGHGWDVRFRVAH